MNPDFAIYAVHTGFWCAFGVTLLVRAPASSPGSGPLPASVPASGPPVTAPFSRAMLAFHMLAFGLMYFGVGNAVVPNRVPTWFTGQRIAGALVIAGGAALACWALVYFQSWRFRAQLEAGHALATGGPFAFVRHPIYAALDLLALGTAIWVPIPTVWIAFVLMVVGSDLRGRAEDRLLTQTFGAEYRDYQKRTRRFVPGLY